MRKQERRQDEQVLHPLRGAQGADQGPDHRGILVPGRAWIAWLVLALALNSAPLLVSRYPPVLDLPQQLAQIDLVGEALGGSGDVYRIQWWAPNKVGYPLLALARAVPARWRARAALLLVAGTWTLALFLLARRAGSGPRRAALASVALWNGSFFGGFVHFLLGLAGLAWWLPELARDRSRDSALRVGARSALGALILYLCHALWLVAGALVAAVALALRRARPREWLATGAGFLPVAVVAGLWYRSLLAAGWNSELFYGLPWWRRVISPDYLASCLFGAIRGRYELALALALALWLVVGAVAAARSARTPHRILAAVGLLFLALALALPEVLGDTTMFGRRWGWVALVCLLLAVPPPPLRPGLRSALVVIVLAASAATQALLWRSFDREWTDGFERLLARIEPGERVLGLDFVRRAPGLWVHPFFQMAAYAQVERGAEIGYSFAEAPSSLVVFRELPARRGWRRDLHKRPDLVSRADLERFDWVLVVAPTDVHLALARRFPGLEPVDGRGPWSLYAVAVKPSDGGVG